MTKSSPLLDSGSDAPGEQPMRIGYLTSQYPAPSHTFIRREIAALEELGWEIDRFSIRTGAAEPDSPASREAARTLVILDQSLVSLLRAHLAWLTTHPFRYLSIARLAFTHRPPGARAFLLACAHFAEAVVVAWHLNRRGCVHLHNHFANSAATVGLLATRLSGASWSFTIHGVSETDYPAGLLLGDKIKAALWVACASWFMRAQGLRTVPPHQWEKLHVIRCGLKPELLAFAPNADIKHGALICVGRLSPEKAHAGLFEAFAAISQRYPGTTLRLVGDGPCRSELTELAASLAISDRVEFLGSCSEERTLSEIANCDLLVLPSLLEGLPVVLMEAMALGVPVVAPRVAGIPELVEDGETGLLFTPSNWDELASRLDELLKNSQLRKRISAQARARIESEFDIKQSAQALSQLLGASCNKRRNPPILALSFGLREAIVLAILVIAISIAVAVTNGASTPGPQPLARGALASK